MLLTDKEAPLWARQLIAVAVLLGVLILTAIGIFIWNNTTTPAPQPRPTPSASATSKPSDSVCGLAAGPADPLTAAPGTDWKLKGGYAYPTSRTAGPGTTTNGVGSCFAHSTAGALLAAATYNVDVATVGVDGADAMVDRLVSDATRARAMLRKSVRDGQSAAPGAWQTAGFRMVDATPDRVVLEMLVKVTASNRYGYTPMTMQWESGDWRFAPGTATPVVTESKDPFGADRFTQWGGVGQ